MLQITDQFDLYCLQVDGKVYQRYCVAIFSTIFFSNITERLAVWLYQEEFDCTSIAYGRIYKNLGKW